MSFDQIAVIGAGAWGVALANVITRAGRSVTLAARDAQSATVIDERRESPRLPGIRLNESIAAISWTALRGWYVTLCPRYLQIGMKK